MVTRVLVIAAVAATCHEVNRAYCASLGDNSQKPWSEAPDWQRASAVNGVEFHLANPDADDAASHNNWMQAKFADGWKHGEVKDEKKKTHPCLVPFEQLPLDQQIKDRLFRIVVHGFADEAVQADRMIVDGELLTAERDAAQEKADRLEGEIGELRENAALQSTAVTGLEKDLAEVSKQRDTLTRKVASLERKAAVTPAARPAKRRKAGPIEGLVDSDKVFHAVKADEHEIVFSDGEEEILAIPPIKANIDAWHRTGAGTMLRVPVTICPNEKVELAGFGLFDGEGKQVAWCAMAQPVAILPGMQVKLDRQIIF